MTQYTMTAVKPINPGDTVTVDTSLGQVSRYHPPTLDFLVGKNVAVSLTISHHCASLVRGILKHSPGISNYCVFVTDTTEYGGSAFCFQPQAVMSIAIANSPVPLITLYPTAQAKLHEDDFDAQEENDKLVYADEGNKDLWHPHTVVTLGTDVILELDNGTLKIGRYNASMHGWEYGTGVNRTATTGVVRWSFGG